MPSASAFNHSVARAGAPIGERLPGYGHELPGVAVGRESELEDPERRRDRLTRWMNGDGQRGALTARAHIDRPEAAQRVHDAIRRHGREALVLVLLPVEHEIGPRRVQPFPPD